MKNLSKTEQIALLATYTAALPPRWSALQNYIAMYFTIILACLGFILTQIIDLFSRSLEILLAVPLIVIALIAIFAIRSIIRQERHIRELIVVVAKMEYIVGLYNKYEADTDGAPWRADPSVLPAPWMNSRLKSGEHSSTFINEGLGGTSKLAAMIFFMIFILCISVAFICLMSHLGVIKFR